MSGTPVKKATRPKAKRAPARPAGAKRTPANATFLTVPEKGMDKTPPMTANSLQVAEAASGGRDERQPGHVQRPALVPTPAADAMLADTDTAADDEDGDVVPELLARRAGSPRSSVSESTLWEHVGLQAGLSVSSAAVPAPPAPPAPHH